MSSKPLRDTLKELLIADNINAFKFLFSKYVYIDDELYNLIVKHGLKNYIKTYYEHQTLRKDRCKIETEEFDPVFDDNKEITRLVLRYNEILPMNFTPTELDFTSVSWTIDGKTFMQTYNERNLNLTDLEVRIKTNDYQVQMSSIIQKKFKFDKDWVKKCYEYMSDLSLFDKFTVYGYTHKGDEIINKILIATTNDSEIDTEMFDNLKNNSFDYYHERYFPFYFQCERLMIELLQTNSFDETYFDHSEGELTMEMLESFETRSELYKVFVDFLLSKVTYKFLYEACVLFIEDLTRIIEDAPAFEKSSNVYRGTKTQYYSTDKGDTFTAYTFVSTSMSVDIALEFADVNNGCCLSEYKINPGTRAIIPSFCSQHPGEVEVLFSPKSLTLSVVRSKLLQFTRQFGQIRKSTYCDNERRKVMKYTLFKQV